MSTQIFNQDKSHAYTEEELKEIGFPFGMVFYDTVDSFVEETNEDGETIQTPAKKTVQIFIPYTEEQKKAIKEQELNQRYIPSQNNSIVAYIKRSVSMTQDVSTEEKIVLSGLYEQWQLGNYAVGDIRNHAGQTWECHRAHDNAIYPDITPANSQTWATFWRPLHGKSKGTARPWVKPWAGTTDMYHAGEFMVYTDEKVYKCLSDTVYSPEEQAGAWEGEV